MKIAFEGEAVPVQKPACKQQPVPAQGVRSSSPEKKTVSRAVLDGEGILRDTQSGFTSEDVDEREVEIQDLLLHFIADLMGADMSVIEELGFDLDTLSAMMDDIESLFDEYGLSIYRPVVLDDGNGGKMIAYNQFSEE